MRLRSLFRWRTFYVLGIVAPALHIVYNIYVAKEVPQNTGLILAAAGAMVMYFALRLFGFVKLT